MIFVFHYTNQLQMPLNINAANYYSLRRVTVYPCPITIQCMQYATRTVSTVPEPMRVNEKLRYLGLSPPVQNMATYAHSESQQT